MQCGAVNTSLPFSSLRRFASANKGLQLRDHARFNRHAAQFVRWRSHMLITAFEMHGMDTR